MRLGIPGLSGCLYLSSPHSRTYTGASVPSRRSRVQSVTYGLGCHKRLNRVMANVPPTPTAGAPSLEALPGLFNEPHVSWEQEAVPWPSPTSLHPASVSASVLLCASFPFLDSSLSVPKSLVCPSPLPPLFPQELRGWGTGLHIQAGAIVQQSVFVLILLAGGGRGAKG